MQMKCLLLLNLIYLLVVYKFDIISYIFADCDGLCGVLVVAGVLKELFKDRKEFYSDLIYSV